MFSDYVGICLLIECHTKVGLSWCRSLDTWIVVNCANSLISDATSAGVHSCEEIPLRTRDDHPCNARISDYMDGKNCRHNFGSQAASQGLNQFSLLGRLLESRHKMSNIFLELREGFSVVLGPDSNPLPEINICQTIPKLIPDPITGC